MMKLLLLWNEIQERARKIAHNSTVKIEATKGREMNTSKSGKTAAQPTPSPNWTHQYRWEQMGHAAMHAPKQNNITQKGSGKLQQK